MLIYNKGSSGTSPNDFADVNSLSFLAYFSFPHVSPSD